jgi:hypothetical protein
VDDRISKGMEFKIVGAYAQKAPVPISLDERCTFSDSASVERNSGTEQNSTSHLEVFRQTRGDY